MGFDSFGEACFEGGIVETMLKIAQDTRTDQWPALASYFALDSMWQLTRTGTIEERRELVKQLVELDAVNICLQVSGSHIVASTASRGTDLLHNSPESDAVSISYSTPGGGQCSTIAFSRERPGGIFISRTSLRGYLQDVRLHFRRAE